MRQAIIDASPIPVGTVPIYESLNRVRRVQDQLDDWVERAKGSTSEKKLKDAADKLHDKLHDAEEQLIQVKARSSQDTLNFPAMLNAKLSALAAFVGGSESAPTQAQEQLCEDLAARVEEQMRAVDAALAEDLPAFNALVRSTDVPAVVVPEVA